MIYIEIPLWLAICFTISMMFHLIHLLISDLFVKIIHKKYDLELKNKEELTDGK